MAALRQSGAHPVWSIAEVVREVMEQNADNAGTLATCARVSHTFSEPALEVLWRELVGLDRLLSILRKSIKRTLFTLDDLPHHPMKRFVFCGPIVDSEWERFKYYANLVRSYTTKNERLDGILSSTFLDKSGGQPLLPRLLHLKWTTQDELSSSFLLFLSPVLRDVHIDFHSLSAAMSLGSQPSAEDYTTAAALRLIHSRAPAVERLAMQACHLCSLNPVPDFLHLRSLRIIQSKDPRIWEKIASSLPLLEDLSVHMFTEMLDEDIQRARNLPQARFGKLTRLDFMADPRMVPIVLDILHAPSMKDLHLQMELNDNVCVRVCQIVASRFAQSVRTFSLELDDDYNTIENARDFGALFSPLYAMRDLEDITLGIRFDTDIVVSADDVSQITEAWPNIRVLRLPFIGPEAESFSPRMPVTALEMFTQRCPKLEVLIMPLPDPAPLADLDLATVPAPSHHLSRLHLLAGEWPDDVVEKGERYIQRLFPDAHILFDEDLEPDDN